MPMWCPPTPPQQEGDMYIDHSMAFLYDTAIMTENELPPVYVKKESKRTRVEAGLIDSRRPAKVHKRDDVTQPPKSIFDRLPILVKIRRDARMQKYRGFMRPQIAQLPGVKYPMGKPHVDQPGQNWTIHEDAGILKALQKLQGLPSNISHIPFAGHTPNWDLVADYVNATAFSYRTPKQCRNRYESVLVPREEGKQIIDTSPRKKKTKGMMYKFPVTQKSSRPMRTSQLYMQDNNNTFNTLISERFDALQTVYAKRLPQAKPTVAVASTALKNPKHESILAEAHIDLDHPLSAIEIAAKRAERIAREKKITPEQLQIQKLQLYRQQQAQAAAAAAGQSTNATNVTVTTSQPVITQTVQVTTIQTAVISSVATASPNTPPNTLRMQRIVAASPLQNQSVVSVSGISPAQLQAATQRHIVAGASGQQKATVVGTGAVAGKTLSPAQLQMIRNASIKQQQQMRLQSGISPQTIKTTAVVSIPGQNALQVQFTQSQPRAHIIKGVGTVAVGNKQITRALTSNEVTQILNIKHGQKIVGQSTTIADQPVFAKALQAGPSGTQVATIVKAVSTSGVTQTVIGAPMKALPQGIKTHATPQQLRALQIQHLMAQKKIQQQKITGIAQVPGKGAVAAQLIVGSKPLSTAMTMQQLQQVIRSPLTVPQGPVVLATKGTSRMIPVNAAQGTKPTIQVVASASPGLTTTIRPSTSSTLTAASLAGLKVQNAAGTTAAQQQAIFSAVLNQNVRQSSPVRIQTSSGTPVVAVSMQSTSPIVQAVQQQQQQQADKNEPI